MLFSYGLNTSTLSRPRLNTGVWHLIELMAREPRPLVISGDIYVQYKINESKVLHEKIFKKECITLWDDLITIPAEIYDDVISKFEKMIQKKKSEKITLCDIYLQEFHNDHGVVNYTPKIGWTPPYETKNPA